MLLYEINPFIRYANKSEFSPINDDVITYDCRLFMSLTVTAKYILSMKNILRKKELLCCGAVGDEVLL